VKLDALEVFYAFYQGDVSKALKGFLKLVKVPEKNIDVDAFYADLDALIEKFQVGRYEKAQADNLARLALKYGLPAPRAFVVLERAIMLVEGVCTQLYRYFDIKEAIAEQFSVEQLLRAEIKRGVKRFTDASVKLVRNLPDIVDRYVEEQPKAIVEPIERHAPSRAPYGVAAIIALIGLLFPLGASFGVVSLSPQSTLYVALVALVLAALITLVSVHSK
jgi:predicted unusual protein kinase regulating ubiquinone biosynthesis (AarF/ABC1/UbiB family)